MSDSVTELSLRWKRAPDAANTIALANVVRGPLYASLIQEVGAFATDRLGSEVPVLLAIARMYMSALRLSDAQSILVTAGKVAPRDANVYRILGEVLLRRGDADRAEKVLERAMQLGATDPGTRLWLDRSRIFKAMQTKAGSRAVAAEVERTAPAASSELDHDEDRPSERTLPVEAIADPPTRVRDLSSTVPPAPHLPPKPAPAPPARSAPPPALPHTRATSLGTGSNDVGGGAALGLTPHGLPKPQPAFLFEKDPPPPNPAALEESVTFDLASSPVGRHMVPSLPEVALDPMATTAQPKPRELLDALSLAGVFETGGRGAGGLEWTKPAKGPKKKGTWLLVTAMVLFVAGSAGTYRYVEQQRTQKRLAAEALMAEIDAGLLEGRLEKIPAVEGAFTRAFELDSRSAHAALAWTRERALVGLVRGGQDVAFEDATSRARSVGIKDTELAFTQIASFLFQNDTAGAVSLLPRFDGVAQNDPWYQLLAGTCLERIGDARAFERYAAAVKLAPDFVPAQIALIRHELLEGDRARALELVAQFRSKHPDRVEGLALAALAWARDPAKPKPPVEASEILTKREGLPLGLATVPHAVAARLALEKAALPDARDAVKRGLTVVDGPGVASWLGFLALDAEDEALARKAALTAVSYSAVYPRARILAARVALLGGRLDEAMKATEELDAKEPEVATARAVVAYERADADGLARALEALPEARRSAPGVSTALLAAGALAGHADIPPGKLVARAASDDLWSDVIAMDVALDTGNLDAAAAIGSRWLAQTSKEQVAALRALRLARLARYQSRLDDADYFAAAALTRATPTIRSVAEEAMVLAAREKPGEIGPILAKYPGATGSLSSWLGAFATARAGKVDDARGRSAALEPPPDAAPAPVRLIAAAALAAMKDRKRGVPVVQSLVSQGVLSPDVVAAGEALGLTIAAPTSGEPTKPHRGR